MTNKQICPPDCPGRFPGCGANCDTFQKHRAESAERYKRAEMDAKIKDVVYGANWRKR